jgi:hypothetical protein
MKHEARMVRREFEEDDLDLLRLNEEAQLTGSDGIAHAVRVYSEQSGLKVTRRKAG